MKEEDLVEIIEIWREVEAGGEAVRDGKNLKLTALLANGHPIRLDEGYLLERSYVSKEQEKNMRGL